jgi:hypothetical protein
MSPESMDGIVRALFGLSAATLSGRVARNQYLVHHGAPARLDALLGRGRVASRGALEQLVGRYAWQISRVVYDAHNTLGFSRLRPVEHASLLSLPAACYFLSDYDAAFRNIVALREALCLTVGSAVASATCTATLQTAGAFVPRHCDRSDVVVLQLFGTRRWRLERNSDPPRGLDAPVRRLRRRRSGWSETFMRRGPVFRLKPGSVLYVPRGWWHETCSAATSLALVISMRRLRRKRAAKRQVRVSG